MKSICKYTGIEFSTEYFGGLTLRSRVEIAHPIFAIPRKQLWSRISDFHLNMDATEQKLCFVALLASTGLVQFRCAALPQAAVMQTCFDRLVKIAAWIDSIQHPSAKFPSFIISTFNADLSNLSAGWLVPLEELRVAWMKADMSPRLYGEAKDAALKTKSREEALDRMIRKAGNQTSKYGGILASWIIDVCKISETEMIHCDLAEQPISMQSFVQKIFATPDVNLLKLSNDDVEYLQEYLIENMPQEAIGTRQGFAAIDACKQILSKQKKVIGILTEDYQILSDDDELLALDTPLPEPRPADYKVRIEYLMAKAQWIQQQAAIARLNEQTKPGTGSNE